MWRKFPEIIKKSNTSPEITWKVAQFHALILSIPENKETRCMIRMNIFRKRVSAPHFKIIPPITRTLLGSPPPFLKILHLPTLPANRSSQVFLVNRNAT